jgi:hypothetical protein
MSQMAVTERREREATRKARVGRDLLAVEWVLIAGAVVLVVAVGFALRFAVS